MKSGLLAALALLVWSTAPAGASFDEAQAYAISQAAVGKALGDYRLLDSRGQVVNLAKLRGRPLLISLVYTSCSYTCSVLTQQLAKVVGIAQEALGADSFAILTIGFDTPNDTPERMASYARTRRIDLPNWRFLSADAKTIEGLTRDLGFVFFPSPKGFDHTAQTTLVDAEGRVYQQLYGDYLPPPSLVEPLKELVFGAKAEARTLSGWLNGVRLLCTIYDPASGRYTFDYSIFIAAGVGLLCLGGVGVFVVRAWRGD